MLAEDQARLAVLIPSYNEAATLPRVLDALLSLSLPLEIIVVDDGSTDGTDDVLRRYPQIASLRHARNEGKGAAIRTALQQARSTVCVTQDADLEYDPREIATLLARFDVGDVDAVYGSRNLKQNPRFNEIYYWGGRLVTLATQVLYGTRLTDEPTGYKLVRTSLIRDLHLEANGFDFCPELTARLLRAGARIAEVPISYHPRSREAGKKITAWDGIRAIWVLIRWRFAR